MSAARPLPLGRNRDFTVFWVGQTFSVLGDAFSIIAIPLLVLEATGSLTMMGLVTAFYGVGSLVAGILGGPLVDRVDRRKLMIRCDLGRFALYLLVPLGWWLFGPQLWLVFLVATLGSGLAMVFGVAYITAVANLVDRDQITEANGRLQVSYALAFAIGPLLAGLVSERYGTVAAVGIDACTFLVSAGSLAFVRLRRAAAERRHEEGGRSQEFLAGVRFLLVHPIFRWLTILTGGLAFASTGITDLLIYYVKEDLGQGDRVVGLLFGVASLGAVASGLLVARLRVRFGWGASFVGGLVVQGLALLAIGAVPSVAGIALLTGLSIFGDSTRGVLTMTLRQELTPDHLLGRVTAAFWTVFSVPGPIGALALTAFGERVGTPVALSTVGVGILGLAGLALASPVRAREPGRRPDPAVFGAPADG
ncbi:MAG TPA: MFS transporter [Thermomicrobiales bacterium]|nr:MFS transporter [Thermomicrobiales bacterium]